MNIILPSADTALAGREQKMQVNNSHAVSGHPIVAPFPDDMQTAMFGQGCFWGAERIFWQLDGVYTTAVGYAAGYTPNPSYQEVCSGQTGHNEVVLIIFNEHSVSYYQLLKVFWASHDPTQAMRQGNDIGTQYRSGIYVHSDQQKLQAEKSLAEYQHALQQSGFESITTEILPAKEFYYAEDYHQQYLAKNPSGYCGLGGLGIQFPDTGVDNGTG